MLRNMIINTVKQLFDSNHELKNDIRTLRKHIDNIYSKYYDNLTFTDASYIDYKLFGYDNNSYWTKAYDFPNNGDIIDNMTVKTVGVFTFAFDKSESVL